MGPVLSCCSAQLGKGLSRSLGVKLAPWERHPGSFRLVPLRWYKCTEPSRPADVDTFVSMRACAPSVTSFFSQVTFTLSSLAVAYHLRPT